MKSTILSAETLIVRSREDVASTKRMLRAVDLILSSVEDRGVLRELCQYSASLKLLRVIDAGRAQ